MNRRTALILAGKAAILSEVTGATVDEAIRYLAATHTTELTDAIDISVLTGISLSSVRKLAEADSYLKFY